MIRLEMKRRNLSHTIERRYSGSESSWLSRCMGKPVPHVTLHYPPILCYTVLYSNLLGQSKSNVFIYLEMMDFVDQDLAIYILHLLDNP
jgi:hypothetical protein